MDMAQITSLMTTYAVPVLIAAVVIIIGRPYRNPSEPRAECRCLTLPVFCKPYPLCDNFYIRHRGAICYGD